MVAADPMTGQTLPASNQALRQAQWSRQHAEINSAKHQDSPQIEAEASTGWLTAGNVHPGAWVLARSLLPGPACIPRALKASFLPAYLAMVMLDNARWPQQAQTAAVQGPSSQTLSEAGCVLWAATLLLLLPTWQQSP